MQMTVATTARLEYLATPIFQQSGQSRSAPAWRHLASRRPHQAHRCETDPPQRRSSRSSGATGATRTQHSLVQRRSERDRWSIVTASAFTCLRAASCLLTNLTTCPVMTKLTLLPATRTRRGISVFVPAVENRSTSQRRITCVACLHALAQRPDSRSAHCRASKRMFRCCATAKPGQWSNELPRVHNSWLIVNSANKRIGQSDRSHRRRRLKALESEKKGSCRRQLMINSGTNTSSTPSVSVEPLLTGARVTSPEHHPCSGGPRPARSGSLRRVRSYRCLKKRPRMQKMPRKC